MAKDQDEGTPVQPPAEEGHQDTGQQAAPDHNPAVPEGDGPPADDQNASEQQPEHQPAPKAAANDPDAKVWKKRYGDSQRYIQKLQEELQEFRRQAQANLGVPQPPAQSAQVRPEPQFQQPTDNQPTDAAQAQQVLDDLGISGEEFLEAMQEDPNRGVNQLAQQILQMAEQTISPRVNEQVNKVVQQQIQQHENMRRYESARDQMLSELDDAERGVAVQRIQQFENQGMVPSPQQLREIQVFAKLGDPDQLLERFQAMQQQPQQAQQQPGQQPPAGGPQGQQPLQHPGLPGGGSGNQLPPGAAQTTGDRRPQRPTLRDLGWNMPG